MLLEAAHRWVLIGCPSASYPPSLSVVRSPGRAAGSLAVVDRALLQEPAHAAHVQWSVSTQSAWSGAPSLSEGQALRIRVDPGAAPGSDGPGIDVELTARRQHETQQLRPRGSSSAANAGALRHVGGDRHRPSVSFRCSATADTGTATGFILVTRPAKVRRKVYIPVKVGSVAQS